MPVQRYVSENVFQPEWHKRGRLFWAEHFWGDRTNKVWARFVVQRHLEVGDWREGTGDVRSRWMGRTASGWEREVSPSLGDLSRAKVRKNRTDLKWSRQCRFPSTANGWKVIQVIVLYKHLSDHRSVNCHYINGTLYFPFVRFYFR